MKRTTKVRSLSRCGLRRCEKAPYALLDAAPILGAEDSDGENSQYLSADDHAADNSHLMGDV
ncbi:hypothetical protein D3C86_1099090 [compost metagenome]